MTSTAERLRKKQQQVSDRNAGRQNTYRFKQAETDIRILPSWRPADHEDPTFFHDFGLTWVKDLDGNVLATVGDRKITFGEEDEVRSLVGRALAQAKTDAHRKHFKEMLASPRVLVNALVLNDKEVDPTVPQIVEFSEAQFTGPITALIVKAEDEGDNILDLDGGFNLTVAKSGSGFETKYTFTLARRASKVEADVMEKLNDIDAFIRAKFADGERARNAIKSLIGEPVAAIERSTDLIEDRGNRVTNEDVVDGDYNIIDDASSDAVEVETHAVSDADIEALFDE